MKLLWWLAPVAIALLLLAFWGWQQAGLRLLQLGLGTC